MTDNKPLLPCPFCGGEPKVISGGPGCAYISCTSCPAETGDGSLPRIVAAWNTRADLARAQVAAAYEDAAQVAEHFDQINVAMTRPGDVAQVTAHSRRKTRNE